MASATPDPQQGQQDGPQDGPQDSPRLARLIDAVLSRASTLIILLTLGGLFLSLMAKVVVRYATNAGLGWPNEAPALLFPWLTMSGAVLAAQYGRHIAVQLLAEKLPLPLARLMMAAGAVLAAATFAFLTWHGLRVMKIVGGEVYPVTGLTANIPYAALIAGFVGLSLTALTTLPLIFSAPVPAVPRDVPEEI